MARIQFDSVLCSGSVDLTSETMKLYESPLTGEEAHEMSQVDVPEAGGVVKLVDNEGYRRITLLAAALHQEIARHVAANPSQDNELNAAIAHLRTAHRWIKTASRKDRTLGLPKAPPPANPFPPKTPKGKPNAQRRR